MTESRGAESQAFLLTDLMILMASSSFLVSKMKIPIVLVTKIKVTCLSITVMKNSMTLDYFQVYFGNENVWYMHVLYVAAFVFLFVSFQSYMPVGRPLYFLFGFIFCQEGHISETLFILVCSIVPISSQLN